MEGAQRRPGAAPSSPAATPDQRLSSLLEALSALLTSTATRGGRRRRRHAERSPETGPDRRRSRPASADRLDARNGAQLVTRLWGRIAPTALSDASVSATGHGDDQPPAADAECAPPDGDAAATPSTGSGDSGESTSSSPSAPRTIYRRIRRGQPPKPRERRPRHKRRGTPKARQPQPFKARVASFLEAEQIDGTGYHLVFRLTGDRIMAHRRGHFEYWRRPKIEVRDTKTSEYRESYSGYCGRQPKLKSWLYYT